MTDSNNPVSGESNAPELAQTLRQQLSKMQKGLKTQMLRALTLLEAEIINNVRSASGLHVRTGALLNSIGASKKVTQVSDGEIQGQIGSIGVPYSRAQELGATITAKNSQFLAIPTQENRRPDGSPIVTTGQLRTLQKLGLAFISKGTIFQRVSKTDPSVTPMFILRRSVDIPAKPYLRPALVAKQEQILKNFGIFIDAAFNSEGGNES